MKTSNKLLIGLLSTILLVISAMFLEIRVFGEHRSERFVESKSEKLPIDDFKHVAIENTKSIEIATTTESNHIHFVSYDDSTEINIKYVVENDTLKISAKGSRTTKGSYTLHTNSNIESISIKGTKIRLSGLHQDSIYFKVSDGEINANSSSKSQVSNFKHAKIWGLNSKIYFWDSKIDDLELEIENSRAEFRKDMNSVNATIKSKSQLHLNNLEKLELVKDKESRIYVR